METILLCVEEQMMPFTKPGVKVVQHEPSTTKPSAHGSSMRLEPRRFLSCLFLLGLLAGLELACWMMTPAGVPNGTDGAAVSWNITENSSRLWIPRPSASSSSASSSSSLLPNPLYDPLLLLEQSTPLSCATTVYYCMQQVKSWTDPVSVTQRGLSLTWRTVLDSGSSSSSSSTWKLVQRVKYWMDPLMTLARILLVKALASVGSSPHATV